MNIRSKITGIMVLRLTVAFIFITHSYTRMSNEGYVTGFGGFLDTKGFSPIGVGVAWAITIYEAIGAALLIWGRWLTIVCSLFIVILLAGIVMVHFQEGWFVVGDGRNGYEYSVLLIASLLCIMLTNLQGANRKSL